MTREHKLALIVGFSLILVVGMLVSDHLSKAKQAKIAGVTPAETAPVVSEGPPPTDPLKTLANLPTPAPQPAPAQQNVQTTPTTLAAAPTQTPGAPTSIGPAPTTTQGDEMIRPASPRTLAAGSDQPLIDHIVQQGGTVHRDRNGNIVFGLPSAAEIASATNMAVPGTVASTSAKPGAAAKPEPLKGGKIYATSRIDNLSPLSSAAAPDKTHMVQKGESLFQIAAKYYGNGHTWRELAKYNGLRESDGGIRVGMKLRIPSRDALLGKTTVAEQKPTAMPATPVQASPEPAKRQEAAPAKPGRIELATYTVKRGDTLGVIAQKVLGSSKRAGEIADFNKLDDEDNIPVGTVLKVPPKRG